MKPRRAFLLAIAVAAASQAHAQAGAAGANAFVICSNVNGLFHLGDSRGIGAKGLVTLDLNRGKISWKNVDGKAYLNISEISKVSYDYDRATKLGRVTVFRRDLAMKVEDVSLACFEDFMKLLPPN